VGGQKKETKSQKSFDEIHFPVHLVNPQDTTVVQCHFIRESVRRTS